MGKICGINTVVQKLSEIQQIQIRNWRMSLDLFSELDFVSEQIHATARGFIVDCRDAWLQSPWIKSCLLWHSRTPSQMLQTEKNVSFRFQVQLLRLDIHEPSSNRLRHSICGQYFNDYFTHSQSSLHLLTNPGVGWWVNTTSHSASIFHQCRKSRSTTPSFTQG